VFEPKLIVDPDPVLVLDFTLPLIAFAAAAPELEFVERAPFVPR